MQRFASRYLVFGAGQFHKTTDVAIRIVDTSFEAAKLIELVKMIRTFKHKNLLLCLAVCSVEEPVWIVTELMVNGDLMHYLRAKTSEQKITQSVLTDMASQIASGMAYLEEQHYVLRNLTAKNVLVGGQSQLRIADFTTARRITGKEPVVSNYIGITTCNMMVLMKYPGYPTLSDLSL